MNTQNLFWTSLFSVFVAINVWAQADNTNSFNLDENVRDKALFILREGLHDDEYAPSLHAAEGLTLAGYGEEVIPVFINKLDRENADARRAGIARELARAGDLSKISLIADILRKNDPKSRVAAAEALYKLGEVGDADAMKAASRSQEDVILHLMASGALVRRGNNDALLSIRKTFSNGDVDAIRIGAWLLGRVGEEEDIDLLKTQLKSPPDEMINEFIYHSMAALGSKEGLARLSDNLNSSDPSIRAYAATFAGDANAISLADKLIEMLDDPVADVTYRAAQTLLIFDLRYQN